MGMTEVMGLLGGLALFLYGMQMMSSGMEAAAGDKMKGILEKLTSNRFLGVGVGALITAIIQSSSATTVMVVGFVNSGMMTLRQSVWIIMGANIGTTITGQLIALDVGEVAPFIAFIGVVIVVFSKNVKFHYIGNIFAGLGVLFIGMDMMGAAMKPLANSEAFVQLLSKFENPLLGILAGAAFTALIQSSSASVGILQVLANSNIVTLSSAAFVLFGQNIGTCITAFLASLGTSRNAKRTTIIHIMFNIIGTIIFTSICMVTPFIGYIEGTAPGNPAAQIANLHTIFNVVTSILLIPFGTSLTFIAEKILPEHAEEESGLRLCYIHSAEKMMENKMGASVISQNNTQREIRRMLEMTKENVLRSFDVFVYHRKEDMQKVDETEIYIDYLHKEISKYISKAIVHERTEKGSRVFSSYYKITSNIERIGDHAENIAGYSVILKERSIQLSEHSLVEVAQIKAVCTELLEHILSSKAGSLEEYEKVAGLEQKIDDMTEIFRGEMMGQIQKGLCSEEGSILFSEMLTDFERIGDHALNISKEMTLINS